MYPIDFLRVLAVAFVTLFPVVNPVGGGPIFLALTGRYPRSAQRMLARKIAAYGFVLLSTSFLFGSIVLDFFGITLAVVQICGGLVVAVTGWGLLNQKEQDPTSGQSSGSLEDALDHAFFPLTLPITVGPGCISIAITLGAHLRHEAGSGFEHGYPRHFIAALVGMFLVCVLVMICLYIRRPSYTNSWKVWNRYSDPPLSVHSFGYWSSDYVEWYSFRVPRSSRPNSQPVQSFKLREPGSQPCSRVPGACKCQPKRFAAARSERSVFLIMRFFQILALIWIQFPRALHLRGSWSCHSARRRPL